MVSYSQENPQICSASTNFDHYQYKMSINELKTIKHFMIIRSCCICYVLNITQPTRAEKKFVQIIQKYEIKNHQKKKNKRGKKLFMCRY